MHNHDIRSVFLIQDDIKIKIQISSIRKLMRSSRNMRLVSSDLRRLQKSVSDKVQKDVESLRQLIDLPDFDVFQFFQTIAKSPKPEELLSKISEEKKIDFFSRNYLSFIETQEAMAKMKLPVLEDIPKAKQFHFEEPNRKNEQQKFQESSVIQIVDAFSVSVLEKKTEECLRILQLIKEMKSHEKYQEYFKVFAIEELFRESYETFLQNCEDDTTLIELGEASLALKKYLKSSTNNFIDKIRTDLYIDNSAQAIKKIMYSLVNFIQKMLKQIQEQYPQKIINQNEVAVILAKWISDVNQQFYHNIQGSIYEKQEVSDVLEALDVILETSQDFQSKGVNLSRDFKTLISHDLPAHMNKIVQVVVEAFEDILSGDLILYEFKYFDGLSSFSFLDDILVPVTERDYGKKCCSKKGILLINSFVIILEPLCDKKWQFLHGSVIANLLQKVSSTILYSNWQYWDYFQLFHFFERLKNGKVKHKKLFDLENILPTTKQQINHISKLSIECWETFEDKVTKHFWVEVLSKIPEMLWEIKPYLQVKSQSSSIKPTVFSMDLIFKFQNFLKILEFRLQRPQFQHLLIRFYQYVLYVMEYILYWEYHHHGQKQKVFLLYKVSDRILKKAKIFAIEQIEFIKENKSIMTISKITPFGVQNLALDVYFFTEALKIESEYSKLNGESFNQKIAQIQAKQHKGQATRVQIQRFKGSLQKFLKILKDEPQKIKHYIESKRNPSRK